MPVLPTFEPQSSPGQTAETAQQSLGTAQQYFSNQQSMMDRASRLRMAEETHAVELEAQRMLAPVQLAKNRADYAEANNRVAEAEHYERLRAEANDEMPALREAWAAASAINDPVERADAQNNVLGRATKYQSLTDFEPVVSAWKNVWANSNVTARTLLSSQFKAETDAQLIAERAKHAEELARVRGDQSRQTAEATGRGMTPGERYRAQLIKARESGNQEAEQFYSDMIAKESAASVSTGAGSAQFRRQMEDVEANGTPEEKEWWRQRSNALNRRGVKQDDREDMIRALVGEGGKPAAPPTVVQPSFGADPFKGVNF